MNSMSTQAKNKHIVEVIKGKLIVDGIPILLSHREFQLFGLLVENKEAFLDNQTIFRTIWQEDWQLDKQPYLGNLVMKIKNKILIETGAEEPFIINKKSIGYRINDAFLIRERR